MLPNAARQIRQFEAERSSPPRSAAPQSATTTAAGAGSLRSAARRRATGAAERSLPLRIATTVPPATGAAGAAGAAFLRSAALRDARRRASSLAGAGLAVCLRSAAMWRGGAAVGSTSRRLASRLGVVGLGVCCLVLVALSGATGASAAPDPGVQVADLAEQYVGSAYRWGGSSPAGFDCTGFVMWVYGQFDVALPHDEAGQLASGLRVAADDLQPGDVLVFANTYRRGLSHVGIYLGDGRFVHAVDESHGVMVSTLWDSYWGPRFVGASRASASA